MNSSIHPLVSKRDILLADREAVQHAGTLKSYVKRFLLIGERVDVSAPSQVRASLQAPIEADLAITDNRFVLEDLMETISGMLDINMVDTGFWQVYLNVLTFGPDSEDEVQAQLDQWIRADALPEGMRGTLARMFIEASALEEHVASLSQTRWERLKMWSHCHE